MQGASGGASNDVIRPAINGDDQSSTGLRSLLACKNFRSHILAALRTEAGSGQSRRCAHRISLFKRDCRGLSLKGILNVPEFFTLSTGLIKL
jgi:hypothetical protein